MPRLLAIAIAAIALGTTAVPAHAATTRAEYVGQVDPICQAAGKPLTKAYGAYRRALKRQTTDVEAGVPEKVALNRFFVSAAKALGRKSRIYVDETAQIAAVVPAPGDEDAVSHWVRNRERSQTLLKRSIAALQRHKFSAAAKLDDKANLADFTAADPVAAFGFHYCTVDD